MTWGIRGSRHPRVHLAIQDPDREKLEEEPLMTYALSFSGQLKQCLLEEPSGVRKQMDRVSREGGRKEFSKPGFLSFCYYYSCQKSTGEIFICIKTYIRRGKKKGRQECVLQSISLSPAQLLCQVLSCALHKDGIWVQGWMESQLLMEHISPEHTSRRLGRR